MSTERELTPEETRIVNLLKVFERATSERKLTVTLVASFAAAEMISHWDKAGIVKTLKADYMPTEGTYAITFTVVEFERYLQCVMAQIGMVLYIDGSIRTYDGLTITNEYLQ